METRIEHARRQEKVNEENLSQPPILWTCCSFYNWADVASAELFQQFSLITCSSTLYVARLGLGIEFSNRNEVSNSCLRGTHDVDGEHTNRGCLYTTHLHSCRPNSFTLYVYRWTKCSDGTLQYGTMLWFFTSGQRYTVSQLYWKCKF